MNPYIFTSLGVPRGLPPLVAKTLLLRFDDASENSNLITNEPSNSEGGARWDGAGTTGAAPESHYQLAWPPWWATSWCPPARGSLKPVNRYVNSNADGA